MYILELNDIMFFIKSLKHPSDHFNINDFISFINSNTRSYSSSKLKYTPAVSSKYSNSYRHFYFQHLPRLWNSLPPIGTNASYHSIKSSLSSYLWSHFDSNFDPHNTCTYHFHYPCNKCVPLKSISSFYF